jgi:hypothetical protein
MGKSTLQGYSFRDFPASQPSTPGFWSSRLSAGADSSDGFDWFDGPSEAYSSYSSRES